eukprot:159394-Pelagomonas_calceolata.AAC.1
MEAHMHKIDVADHSLTPRVSTTSSKFPEHFVALYGGCLLLGPSLSQTGAPAGDPPQPPAQSSPPNSLPFGTKSLWMRLEASFPTCSSNPPALQKWGC